MGTRTGKTVAGFVLAAMATASMVATAAAQEAPAPPVTIQVLGTNDFHGRLLVNPRNTVTFPTCEAQSASEGAALLAGAVEQLRGQQPNTVFAAAGDLIGASTFDSFIAHDRPTLAALNAAGLEVSAVGNHELDQGYADLTERVMQPYDPVTNPFGGAEWAYLAANVRHDDAAESPALPETWTEDFDGVEVGFVGAVTEQLPSLVSPAGIEGLVIERPVVAANRAAAQLKADGADIVVLLVHEGAATTDVSSATDPASDFGDIVVNASPDIDAIISGHTHLAYNFSIPVPAWQGRAVQNRPVVSAGQYAFGLNQLVFTYDPTGGAVTGVTSALLPLQGIGGVPNYPADPAVVKIVCDAVAQASVLGAVELGQLTGPFNRAKVTPITSQFPAGTEDRGGESTVGNLVAEVQRDQTGADIAFMNPGGLRTDMTGSAGSPPSYPAPLTYQQAATVQPFANTLVNMTLTGAQIKTALEQQWQPAGASRPVLRLGISDGFRYTYDPAATAGSRITQMWLHDVPVTPTATYSVTVNSFLAAGGDNFFVLATGTGKRDTGKVDLQSMVDYLAVHSPVSPDFSQRSVGVTFPNGAPASYEAGQTVAFTLSSLIMPKVVASPGDVVDATVSVALDGTVVATPTVDATVGADLTDEYGKADVSFVLPAGTTGGAHTLTITGATTGTVTTIPLTTRAASSTTTLDPSAPSQMYGSADRVTLTATVTSAGVTPTGSVSFVSGSTVLATVPLANGTASYRLPANQPAGSLTVTAVYGGAANTIAGSASRPVTVTITKATSTTVLVPTRTSQKYGAILPTLLISGTGLDNGQIPQGYIEVRDGGTVVARTGMLVGLSLYVVPRTLPVGTHTYTATFVPFDTANYATSTSAPVTIRVTR